MKPGNKKGREETRVKWKNIEATESKVRNITNVILFKKHQHSIKGVSMFFCI